MHFGLVICVVILFRANVPARAEHLCGSVHIAFRLHDLAKLTNCTVVRGSVTIAMLDMAKNPIIRISSQYSFPKLREITGHLIYTSINGITNMGGLFPNLVIIRGHKLVNGFALIVWDNHGLEHFSLESLTTIQHGFALIRRNPMLCYAHAIDWHRITDDDELQVKGHEHFIQNTTYSVCPTVRDCTKCNPQHCWDADNCQKSESPFDAAVPGRMKCHSLCVGGCVNETADGCSLCRGPLLDGHCVQKCPPDRPFNPMLSICVKNCADYNMFALNGTCLYQCPAGSSHIYDVRKSPDYDNCYPCQDECPIVCKGGLVTTLDETRKFRGCTVINGSLYIRLENHSDPRNLLEDHFKHVQQIHGYLTIMRSAAITSLDFFRNLSLIHYIPPAEPTKIDDMYAVLVASNPNLNQLWDWNVTRRRPIEIIGGAVKFHNNPKLCVIEINKFVDQAKHGHADDLIATDTNGYEEVCEFETFQASVILNTSSIVTVVWEPFVVHDDDNTLVGYEVYYVTAPSPNITYRSRADACSRAAWMTNFVGKDELYSDRAGREQFRFELHGLQSKTQYAYYVKAHVAVKTEKTSVNITQGRSDIQYFQTFPLVPLPPFVQTKHKTDGSITLSWFHPSWDVDSHVERYYLDVYRIRDDSDLVAQRNYCVHPKEHTISDTHKYVSQSRLSCCEQRFMRFVSGFFGLDGDPDMCGPSDPNCTNHVVQYMLNANTTYRPDELDAVRDEELPLLRFPLPTNPQYETVYRRDAQQHDRHPDYMYTKRVEAHVREQQIRNLIPFERYAFQMSACNNQGCSPYFVHYERTLRRLDADAVAISISRIGLNAITVHIVPPMFPNGKTVAYIVERQMSTNILHRTCFTPTEMQKSNFSVNYLDMIKGTHLIRARSISLGSDGPWSDAQYVIVDDRSMRWRFNIIGMLFAVTLVALLYYLYLRFWRRKDRVMDSTSESLRLAVLNRRSSEPLAPMLRMAPATEVARIRTDGIPNEHASYSVEVENHLNFPQPRPHQVIVDMDGNDEEEPTPANTHDRVRLIPLEIVDDY